MQLRKAIALVFLSIVLFLSESHCNAQSDSGSDSPNSISVTLPAVMIPILAFIISFVVIFTCVCIRKSIRRQRYQQRQQINGNTGAQQQSTVTVQSQNETGQYQSGYVHVDQTGIQTGHQAYTLSTVQSSPYNSNDVTPSAPLPHVLNQQAEAQLPGARLHEGAAPPRYEAAITMEGPQEVN